LRTFEKLIAGRFDRKCAKGERVMWADERKLGGCRFYVKNDLRFERYADDNSIKRLRCKNWYLCFSLFCFCDLCLGK